MTQGWFGPRGVASIIIAAIVIKDARPEREQASRGPAGFPLGLATGTSKANQGGDERTKPANLITKREDGFNGHGNTPPSEEPGKRDRRRLVIPYRLFSPFRCCSEVF